MGDVTIGLLHPGQMGASVGGAAVAGGVRVLWASQGRSEATKGRAEENGLVDAGTLGGLVGASDTIISVCPPGAALEVAEAVSGLAFRGLYVDANAISTGTARAIAKTVERAGAGFVDGGIIGPPARARGTTRMYVAGEAAASVAALFDGTALEAIPLAGEAGTASALKMAYAAYTKGSAALLMLVRSLAVREGVEEALLAEWGISQPKLAERSENAARGTALKAWRFAPEMVEIAETMEEAGLPGGFHLAAAEIYGRLEAFKDAPSLPEFADVMVGILGSNSSQRP